MNELLELLQKRLLILPVWGWLLLGAHQLWRRLNELPRPAPVARMEWGPKPLEYPVRYPQQWKIAGTGAATVVRFLGEVLGVTLEEVEALLTKYFLLAGRPVGQVGIGSTAAKGNLTLESTSNAEKGSVLFGIIAAINEANTRLGVGTITPAATLDLVTPNAAATSAATGLEAQRGIKQTGGSGGESTATGIVKGGAGSTTQLQSGSGGTCPNATTSATGGNGGTCSINSLAGVAITASCTGLVKGGASGNVGSSTGAGGAASNTGAGTSEGGASGNIEHTTGKGGAGSTKPGPSGRIIFKTGVPGGLIPGAEGNTGEISLGTGNANGTGKPGPIVLTCGQGGTEGTGGEFLVKSGKEVTTTKIQVTQSGMGFFGASPVAQAAAITKMVKKEGEAGVTAELIEKVNQLVKGVAAAEGGIGIFA